MEEVPRSPSMPAGIPGKKPRPRWILSIQAKFWRTLMGIGMFLHKMARPRPPKPDFTRKILTTVAKQKGFITLHFYVPKDWHNRNLESRYPVVVNFHGGGFTLGSATDDARWAKVVVQEVNAVVVSVDYRRAPEHPFPTAVEDGVDAIVYLAEHAKEFNLDLDKIAVSGFSSGANMAFTVPLRLQEELEQELAKDEARRMSVIEARRPGLQKAFSEGRILVKASKTIAVKAVVAWYPSVDYTHTREQRRATCARIDQQLPAVFTDLFDDSYLQPPTMDMANPYLSPGVAPDHMLAGLPQEIILFTCEWDMLLAEGIAFRDKLRRLGKTVHYSMVPNAPHGWDKAPNPLKQTPGVQAQYLKACDEMKRLLGVNHISEVEE
ncbi:alpha/beta-hydrolase [Tothia fuscella]|uniref:Alpha/beta-hydrolase n=1 Tax=Tothia fuscella TaxID=1048955 RepID=A0A9P4NXB9_9PEZI|nr:alpha/beta-hydrolase [Tothia fuscella]